MGKRPSLAESMRQVAQVERATPAPPPPVAIQRKGDSEPPKPAAPPASYHAATRVGKKKVTASITPADHKKLKGLAVDNETTTEALLDEAIQDLFAKYAGR